MAFTRILGPGIHTASNINSHNINSTGIITAVSFVGDGSGLTGVASTDNIITGTAATFTGGVDINSDLDVDGHINLDNVSIAGVTTFSGAISGTTANFSGNVTVGGVLTYEDVKNVDSVGLGTFREGIFIPDNKKLEIGNQVGSGDLQIYHDTTHGKSFIQENGPASLHIQASNIVFDNAAGSKRYINLADGGAATIYFNNLPRIDTTQDGVDIGGTGSLKLPSGTTAQRNSSPTNGDLRYNTTTDGFEGYADGDWGPIGGVGAGGTWSSYTAGIATTKSVGVNTNNLDDNDLVGVGNSFQGLYISNGMMITDNKLSGNHYIGTAFNGLMAGPVTVEGTLTIDGNYVVV